jgi:LysM repeat protein
MKNLPWLVVGVAAVGVGGYMLYSHAKPAGYPALPPATKLDPALKTKVDAQIATSKNPTILKQLAAGLEKIGATKEAQEALAKVAEITGQPLSAVSSASASASPTSYTVAPGDIPGAIAKRFGVALSALAKANGTKAKRIMGGQIFPKETLQLPAGVVDAGKQKHASGVAA